MLVSRNENIYSKWMFDKKIWLVECYYRFKQRDFVYYNLKLSTMLIENSDGTFQEYANNIKTAATDAEIILIENHITRKIMQDKKELKKYKRVDIRKKHSFTEKGLVEFHKFIDEKMNEIRKGTLS